MKGTVPFIYGNSGSFELRPFAISWVFNEQSVNPTPFEQLDRKFQTFDKVFDNLNRKTFVNVHIAHIFWFRYILRILTFLT